MYVRVDGKIVEMIIASYNYHCKADGLKMVRYAIIFGNKIYLVSSQLITTAYNSYSKIQNILYENIDKDKDLDCAHKIWFRVIQLLEIYKCILWNRVPNSAVLSQHTMYKNGVKNSLWHILYS